MVMGCFLDFEPTVETGRVQEDFPGPSHRAAVGRRQKSDPPAATEQSGTDEEACESRGGFGNGGPSESVATRAGKCESS